MLGCIDLSEEINITTIGLLDQLNSPVGITLYPNPMSEYANLKFQNTKESHTVKLYSVEGKLIQFFGSNITDQLEIYRSNIKAGLYILEIQNTDQTKFYHLPLVVE